MFTGDYGFFDYKYDIPGYSGQDFGGPAQWLYLALSALLIVLLLLALRKAPPERIRRIVGFTGVFLTLLYLGKTCWESVYDIRRSGAFNACLLPLDSCSIVMPAAILAGFGRGRAQRSAACWLATGGIVGGLGAMVRLNAFRYYPFFSFGAFYSMLWHLMMVLLGLLLAATEPACADERTVRRGFLFHLLFSLIVIPVDFLFGFDFMLYRELGGLPVFEDVAARLRASGLSFLNPLLMLALYLLAFWLVSGLPRLLRGLRRGRRKPDSV